jgi:hypothetical protein
MNLFYRDLLKSERLEEILKTKILTEKINNETFNVTVSHFFPYDLFRTNKTNVYDNAYKLERNQRNKIDALSIYNPIENCNNGLYLDIMGKYIIHGGENTISEYIITDGKLHNSIKIVRVLVVIPPKYRYLIANPIKNGIKRPLSEIKDSNGEKVFEKTCKYIKDIVGETVKKTSPTRNNKSTTKINNLIRNDSLKYFPEMSTLAEEILNENDTNILVEKAKKIAEFQKKIGDKEKIDHKIFEKTQNDEIKWLKRQVYHYRNECGNAVREKVEQLLKEEDEKEKNRLKTVITI